MSVAKVGKAKTSGSAVDYVFGKQKDVEKQPQVIGGNIFGTTRKEIKAEFREQEKLNSKVKNTVTHFSISFPARQTISDEDAADFADELMRTLGYDKNPYTIVRHYDKENRDVDPYAHIHIVASRVKNDGTLVPEWKIAEKTIEATKEIDKKFNFESAEYIKLSAEERRERNIKKDEYQMMTRTGKLSVLEEFKDCAEISLGSRKDVQKFIEDVQAGGFEALPNVSNTTSRMNGFSFSKDGIVFTASRAGRKFKWANLSKEINYQPERDTKFLQKLKAEVLAKKESEKQPEKITKTVKNVTEAVENPAEVTKNEATRERATIKQSTENRTQADRNPVAEKSFVQTNITAVEKAARNESGASLAEAPINGAKSAVLRNDRTDNQTTRSRQKIAGNDPANFITIEPNEKADTSTDARGERRIDRLEARSDELDNEHRKIKMATELRPASDSRSKAKAGENDERISEFSNLVGEDQSSDGKGFEHSGNSASRLSDRSQRAANGRDSTFVQSRSENERSDKFDSAKNSGSERSRSLERAGVGEESQGNDFNIKVGNRAADFGGSHNGVLLVSEQRFKRGIGGAETNNTRVNETPRSKTGRSSDDEAELRRDDNHAQTNVPGGGELLQSAGSGKGESDSKELETNRRTAETTAQIINVKRFSGCLDARVVTAWTEIIEKSNAAEFLDEIVNPKSQEEQQKVFQHLDKQAEIIAQKLKLPKPEPQAQTDAHKLASALTRIEVANYEEATGRQVGEKTFEILVKKNILRAAEPLLPQQFEQIRQNSDLPTTLDISSNLEAETLNALLDVARTGFDAELVFRAQRYVSTNEAAAREMTTLVQLAYGGQANKFTEGLKFDLAEQLYYSPTPAIDIYQDFRQFDWQKTIESFAPTVNNLAEQYKIEIKPPGGDGERNRMLADFVAQDLVRAYESQNSPMEKYVQNGIAEIALKMSRFEVQQTQKNTIADSTDKNLESPEFSSSLEAGAYNLTKQDDDKKAERAVEVAEVIREAAKIKAEQQTQAERQKVRVLTMD